MAEERFPVILVKTKSDSLRRKGENGVKKNRLDKATWCGREVRRTGNGEGEEGEEDDNKDKSRSWTGTRLYVMAQ